MAFKKVAALSSIMVLARCQFVTTFWDYFGETQNNRKITSVTPADKTNDSLNGRDPSLFPCNLDEEIVFTKFYKNIDASSTLLEYRSSAKQNDDNIVIPFAFENLMRHGENNSNCDFSYKLDSNYVYAYNGLDLSVGSTVPPWTEELVQYNKTDIKITKSQTFFELLSSHTTFRSSLHS